MQRKKRKRQIKKAKKRSRISNAKKELLRTLDLPIETEATTPKATMIGRSDLLIENHTGILQYGHETIRLDTYEGILEIEGSELELMQLQDERAYIKGRIARMEFLP